MANTTSNLYAGEGLMSTSKKTVVLLAMKPEAIKEYFFECTQDEYLAIVNFNEITDENWLGGYLNDRPCNERSSGHVARYQSTIHLFYVRDCRNL